MSKSVNYINTAIVGDFERGYYVSKDDAIIAVEIERKEMLDKICKWLEENAFRYVETYGSNYEGFDMQGLLEDFRKSMEE